MWSLIETSRYTATPLQDLFINFGLIKFSLAKVLHYKATLTNYLHIYHIITTLKIRMSALISNMFIVRVL